MRRTHAALVWACTGVLVCGLLNSCSGEPEEDGAAAPPAAAAPADTLTRRQRDSVIARSRIPGAGAVGRALDAADKANAHNTTYDTIR